MPSRQNTEQEALAGEIRRYRVTVRTRLALTYSALLTGSGVVMLALIYAFMRFVPTYAFTPEPSVPAIPVPGATEGAEVAALTTPATELVVASTDELLNLLLVISAIVLILLALAGVWVGWAVAGRMLKPLQYLNGAARQAAGGDLRQRVRLEGPRDEITELAANFDHMLEQLERSFTASRRFASNASHELLTPLATTRAMLDVAIAQDAEAEQRTLLDRLRLMNERSIETAQALIELARIESSSPTPEPVDLAACAAAAVEMCAPDAEESGVAVDLDLAPASIAGEPVLARQLVTNLVQNAIRHNLADGGFVTVRTRAAGECRGGTLVVENSGRVLSEADLTQLTEPFVRASGRSSTAHPGHGLGLSIVSAIVDRFGGTLGLAARPEGGLRVTVTLP